MGSTIGSSSTATKDISIREKLFFILYALYEISYYIFGASRINTFFNTSHLTFGINLLVMLGLVFFIATNKYTFNQFVIISVGLLLGLYAFWIVKLNILLMAVMFMGAAKNVNLNRFIRADLILRTVLLCSIIFANRIGLIPSLTGLREGPITIVRNTLGFGQYNITGALIMICLLEYMYLKFGRISIWGYGVIFIVIFLTLALTNSRGSMLASILYVCASVLTQFRFRWFQRFTKWLAIHAGYIFILLTIISTITVMSFNGNNSIWQTVNRISSDRINILSQYYQQFGMPLLPQAVSTYRSAGIIVMDNVYVTLAIQYGVLVLGLFTIFYYVLCQRALFRDNIEFILMLIALMIFGMIESTFFMIGINFTLIMVFANSSPVSDHILRSVKK